MWSAGAGPLACARDHEVRVMQITTVKKLFNEISTTWNEGPWKSAAIDTNMTVVLPHTLENDFDIALALKARELLAPL